MFYHTWHVQMLSRGLAHAWACREWPAWAPAKLCCNVASSLVGVGHVSHCHALWVWVSNLIWHQGEHWLNCKWYTGVSHAGCAPRYLASLFVQTTCMHPTAWYAINSNWRHLCSQDLIDIRYLFQATYAIPTNSAVCCWKFPWMSTNADADRPCPFRILPARVPQKASNSININ